jgi:hypothetical protein
LAEFSKKGLGLKRHVFRDDDDIDDDDDDDDKG